MRKNEWMKHGSNGRLSVWDNAWLIELSTNLPEVSQCPEETPTRAYSLLTVPTGTFTIKTVLNGHLKWYVDMKLGFWRKDHNRQAVLLAKILKAVHRLWSLHWCPNFPVTLGPVKLREGSLPALLANKWPQYPYQCICPASLQSQLRLSLRCRKQRRKTK